MRQFFTYFSLVLTMALWGGTFIAGRALAGVVTPANASFLRFAIATIALFWLTLLVEGRLVLPSKKEWIGLLLLGLTGVFSYNVFFFRGLEQIEAGRAALIIALNPLIITLFAIIFFKESFNGKQAIGVFLSLAGAVFVIGNGRPEAILSNSFGKGELAILGCVLSWAAYSLIGRAVLSTLSPLTSVFYSSLLGTLLLQFVAIRGGLLQSFPEIRLEDWGSLAYLGLCGTALGFTLYYNAIKKIGAARASVFINLVPLFSIMFSWIILDEAIKPMVIFGGVILLIGVTVTNSSSSN